MMADNNEIEVVVARKALQTILDMPCPFGREGELLGAAQRVASEAITELNRLGRPVMTEWMRGTGPARHPHGYGMVCPPMDPLPPGCKVTRSSGYEGEHGD